MFGRRDSRDLRIVPRGVDGREVEGRSAVRRSSSARRSFSDVVGLALVVVEEGGGFVEEEGGGAAMSAKRSSRTSSGLDMAGCILIIIRVGDCCFVGMYW